MKNNFKQLFGFLEISFKNLFDNSGKLVVQKKIVNLLGDMFNVSSSLNTYAKQDSEFLIQVMPVIWNLSFMYNS